MLPDPRHLPRAARVLCSPLASDRALRIVLGVVVTLVGALYVAVERLRCGEVRDLFFVPSLVGATIGLLTGLGGILRFLDAHGPEAFRELTMPPGVHSPIEAYARYRQRLTHRGGMFSVAIVYGLAIGSAPWVLGAWPSDPVLRVGLACFLFAVNFVTGFALYPAIVFVASAVVIGRSVTVSLWRRRNAPLRLLLGATARISLLASVYIGVCNASVLWSVFRIQALVYAYAVFAAVLCLSLVLVPSAAIALRVNTAKQRELDALDVVIERTIAAIQTGTDIAAAIEALDQMLALRRRIAGMPIWPFRLGTVVVSMGVLGSSLLPIVVDRLLVLVMRA